MSRTNCSQPRRRSTGLGWPILKLLLVLGVLGGPGRSLADEPELMSDEWFNSLARKAPLQPGAAAEVLYDGRVVGLSLDSRGMPTTTIRQVRVVRIQQPEGLEEALVSYGLPEDAKVVNFKAVTRHKDGTTERQTERREVPFLTVPTGFRPARARQLRFAFRDVRVGDLIAYDITERIPKNGFSGSHFLEGSLPIHRAELRLESTDVQYAYQSASFKGESQTCTKTWRGIKTCYVTFGLTDYLPVDDEPFVPQDARVPLGVVWSVTTVVINGTHVPLFATWQELHYSAYDVVDTALSEPARIPRPAGAQAAPVDQIVALWQSAQQALDERAAFVSQHRTARATLASTYGDESDRTVLLTSLLEQASLNPTLLLVPAAPWKLGKNAIPPLLGLSAMVIKVALSDQTLLLDPSCLGCAPGELRSGLLGREALELHVSSNKDARLVGTFRIPTEPMKLMPRPEDAEAAPVPADPASVQVGTSASLSLPSSASQRFVFRSAAWNELFNLDADLELTPRGLLMRDGSFRVAGISAAALRHTLWQNHNQQNVSLPNLASPFADGLDDERMGCVNPEEAGEPLELELRDTIIARTAYSQSSNQLLISWEELLPDLFMGQLKEKRSFPLDLREMPDVHASIHLKLPPNHEPTRVPSSTSLHLADCSYSRQVEVQDDALQLVEDIRFTKSVVPVERYPEFYQKCIQAIRTARHTQLLFTQRP